MAAKPWEKYQDAGPWERYSAPPEDAEIPIESAPMPIQSITEIGAQPDELPSVGDPDIPEGLSEEGPYYTLEDKKRDFWRGVGKDALGLGDVALMALSGATVDVAVGAPAAIATAVGTTDLDTAANVIRNIQEKWTYQPRSERAQEWLFNVAKPMMQADQAVDDIAMRITGEDEDGGPGNPIAAAVLKTTLYGALELIVPGKTIANTARARLQWMGNKEKARKLANDMGLKLDQPTPNNEGINASIVDAAARMTPDERAANMPALRQALDGAKKDARDAKNAAFLEAKRSRTYVETGAVEDLANDIKVNLVSDPHYVQLKYVPQASEIIDELASFRFDRGFNLTSRNLRELEGIRRRASTLRKHATDGQERFAAGVIAKEIDDFMVRGYSNAMSNVGRQYIRGDLSGIQAWKTARDKNVEYMRFNPGAKDAKIDKIIATMINQESTPSDYLSLVFGMSATGSKKEAAAVVRRIKEVLGPDHPSVVSMRQDFIYEVAMPLLKPGDDADYLKRIRTFINNYENVMVKNKPLLTELGIDHTNLRALYTAAKTASTLPKFQVTFSVFDITQAFARLWQGHEISKKALRVSIANKILNKAFGLPSVPHREVMMRFAKETYGIPLVPKTSLAAAEFAIGMGIGELAEVGVDAKAALENFADYEKAYGDYMDAIKNLGLIEED